MADWHCKQIPNGQQPIVVCERETLTAENERLRAEIERLRAIAEFAAHSDGCEQPWHGIQRVCTCGLMELWEARRG